MRLVLRPNTNLESQPIAHAICHDVAKQAAWLPRARILYPTRAYASIRVSDQRDYSGKFGISLAVSVVTLRKLSSDDLPEGAFPILCEYCGHRAVVPVAEGTTLDEHELRLTVRCVVCRSRRLTRARNTLIALRRKVDRRATSR
jgi:DNA-directed RNA polymerase subunit RPC12/RpoP